MLMPHECVFEVASLDTGELRLPQPPVVSVPVVLPSVAVTSCQFEAVAMPASGGRRPATTPSQTGRRARKQSTRVKPPRDVIRLEDRLRFLLQPPLENLLADVAVDLPFRPFPYQLDGIAFLLPRNSAVLADEMGLGKTMQAAIALRLLLRSGQARRVLLVCPKPLVTNWQREFTMWANELPVCVIAGPKARREFLWRQRALLTLVNYETLVRDSQFIEELGLEFDIVVLDEAQRIKNTSGATSGAVRGLIRRRSWALTGTPIENSADDLVGLFEFVAPGTLHTGMKPAAMGRAICDSVIRRTKDQVLDDLPPKLISDPRVDLTSAQWETYQRAEQDGVVQLGDMGKELTLTHVFELVLRLKQICNFEPVTGESAKLEQLQAELEECVASGRKAIVFSQWVDTLDRIAKGLVGINTVAYHGRVPHSRRDGVIEKFRDDPNTPVILMSYGAGSVGLNLQFAEYVFLFDRWWNPAVEDQAINRAHRIGATGPVTVHRYLAAGTIEERIDQILQQKRELFASVFDDGAAPACGGLSRDELLSLFDLRTPEGRLAA